MSLLKGYDIVINGGGIVGFTLLNLILKSPHLQRCKVLLIEQAPRPTNFRQQPRDSETSFSNRVSSITQKSKLALESIGVWKDIRDYSKEVKRINVWNYDYSDKISFDRNPGDPNNVMFSVVENNRLLSALLNNLSNHSRANEMILWNHTLDHLQESAEQELVEVIAKNKSSEETLSCNAHLILGCDGYKSKIRDYARLKYTELELEKSAVVGTVRMTESFNGHGENSIAFQKFSSEKDTVIALLPLNRDYSSFVISAPTDYSNYLLNCDEEIFTQEVNRLLMSPESPNNAILQGLHDLTNLIYRSTTNFVQNSTQMLTSLRGTTTNNFDFSSQEPPSIQSLVENSRASFPLKFGTTSPHMVAPLPGKNANQIALLGDSSHRVHPLAGQGLNLGIQDAIEFVEQLEIVAKCGERIFNQSDHSLLSKVLKNYECRRQAYIVPMSAGILSMPSLFKFTPSSFVSAVDNCSFIKTASVKVANGC